jgi:histidinol-phosphate aminotransferase
VALDRLARENHAEDIPVPSPRAKLFFLTTPHSPYGFSFPTRWIARLLEGFHGIVVADEAYADFAPESALPLLPANPRLIVVRSLSKAYSLAGMRVGLAFAHESLVAEMMKVKDSYNLSRPAQEAACAALADREHLERTKTRILATRERFTAGLKERGYMVLPSHANFVFAVPPEGLGAEALYEGLLRRGFLVRHFSSPGLSDGLRISMGTDEEMDALSGAMEDARGGGKQ